MGDSVERALEETVPILHAAQRTKLLLPTEIKEVVRTRRNHEYAVSSRTASRADFLKYASFERELANALSKRAKKRKLTKHKVELVVGKTAARVNLVFSRAVKRFHGDDELWLHYARHCLRTGAIRAAGRVLGKALGFRPDSEDIWLAAVGYHFDTLADARSGRAMAQRALRALPDSKRLWKEYFRLEMLYLAKLVSRRVTLGLSLPNIDCGEANEEVLAKEDGKCRLKQKGVAVNENKEAVAVEAHESTGLPENGDAKLPEVNDEVSALEVIEDFSTVDSKELSFWDGGVPMTVFLNACKKVTLTPWDCTEMWDMVASTPFIPENFLKILRGALTDGFPNYAPSVLINIRLPWDVANSRFTFKQTLNGGEPTELNENRVVKSADLKQERDALVKWSADVFSDMESALRKQKSLDWDADAEAAILRCIESFEATVARLGKSDVVLSKANSLRTLVTSRKLASDNITYGDKELRGKPVSTGPAEWQVSDLVEMVVEKNCALTEPVYNVFKRKVLVPFRDMNQEKIICSWLGREPNVNRLREIYDTLLRLPPSTMGTLRAAISAELRLWADAQRQERVTETERAETIQRTRRLYNLATQLSSAKQDVDLWLDYIDFERKIGQDEKQATIVGWKATKVLDETKVELFNERQTLQSLVP